MSRGQQRIAIDAPECLQRAAAALRAEGYTVGGSGNFAQGFKGPNGAYIACNDAPGGGSWINTFVASLSQDAGVPGEQRQRLQAQMDRRGAPPMQTSWTGDWDIRDSGLRYAMRLSQSGNRVTGSYGYQNGRVEGVVTESNVLNLNWFQDGGRQGTAQFALTPDGKQFRGSFTVTVAGGGSPAGSRGDWNGERASQ
jgi:hypothetical protein